MNSSRSEQGANGLVARVVQKSRRSRQPIIDKIKSALHHRLATKYCTCQNYMTISQINRTMSDKQCILRTTVNDLKYNSPLEHMQTYYTAKKSQFQLPQLVQYYKYYSQKSVIFIKEYFPMMYQYQERRKVIQYNRLKVLLNLSESDEDKKNKEDADGSSRLVNKSRIGISRNFVLGEDDSRKLKGYQGVNILDQLSITALSKDNEHQQSLLINRLRNNLSKHIGHSKSKNLSIQQIDNMFDFQKKDQTFNFTKQQSHLFFSGSKPKTPMKQKKFIRQQTYTNTPDQNKKGNIRRRSAKRNNSCETLTRISAPKNPYEPTTASKLRRKKNLSMDNLYTHTSTPYVPEQKKENGKLRKGNCKVVDKERYFKQKQNTLITKGPQIFMQSITDLKNKIKRQKQKLMKATTASSYASLKRQKVQYTSINTANQRFTKKNYQKLRQKTVVNFH